VSLLDEVRLLLEQDDLPGYRLQGEDLVVLGPERLRRAADHYDAELEKFVPPSLREKVTAERVALLSEAHAFVTRYNDAIFNRIAGYLELGRRIEFEYPWPVVAILGICQVLGTVRRVHALGLVGAGLERLGYSRLAMAAEKSDDVLRRTNRGIFADSVPTVLYALRCRELALGDRGDLSRPLLDGPCPVWMDAESQKLARALVEGLAIHDADQRFQALSALTLRHFAREQAIFSFHMGLSRARRPVTRPPSGIARLFEARSLSAPKIVDTRHGRKLVFARFPLPEGFTISDHEARVRVLGDAFVRSVTRSRADYRLAVEYVQGRFGRRKN
jgi:hypothetical protein